MTNSITHCLEAYIIDSPFHCGVVRSIVRDNIDEDNETLGPMIQDFLMEEIYDMGSENPLIMMIGQLCHQVDWAAIAQRIREEV